MEPCLARPSFRAEVKVGNDLSNPNLWMYSLYRVEPRGCQEDHDAQSSQALGSYLTFHAALDVPHRIALTDADIRALHVTDGHEEGHVPVSVVIV